MSGAYAFKVVMFLRLVIDCRLTCLYPLLSFSVYHHSDEGSGRAAWPMRSAPKTVVKSTSAFECFGTNR